MGQHAEIEHLKLVVAKLQRMLCKRVVFCPPYAYEEEKDWDF
jgi:hypothetical protein